ncbi:MAG: cobalamin-dependent protein, partial [Clostridia bacterium]|nr:cobalamin-dependent protein [Clostridia bacterium]
LDAAKTIKEDLGCNTSLGISNVSFGLPNRDAINSSFLIMALQSGLSAAIVNPNSAAIMNAYFSFNALNGVDKNCSSFIENVREFSQSAIAQAQTTAKNTECETSDQLQTAIIKGLKDQAATICEGLLKSEEPLDIVNKKIIPALDVVGVGFENKTMYLPQLLMAAEASQCAFEKIKTQMAKSSQATEKKQTFVLATVKGDIHDIGKNIVKLILENYGFDVIDLGKDVDASIICDEVCKNKHSLVGLSALMTTTLPSMKETIALLKQKAP